MGVSGAGERGGYGRVCREVGNDEILEGSGAARHDCVWLPGASRGSQKNSMCLAMPAVQRTANPGLKQEVEIGDKAGWGGRGVGLGQKHQNNFFLLNI